MGELPLLALALRILALSEDPVAGVGEVAKIIVDTPKFSQRILRIANSPFYASRRKIENLRQALSLLGFNATVTLALSVSFTASVPTAWFESRVFWRRTALSAIAARTFGEFSSEEYSERYFQAGLLQDIAELVFDSTDRAAYASVYGPAQAHAELAARELKAFGCSHAEVGAALLQSWSAPAILSHAVLHSHGLDLAQDFDGLSSLDKAVALSGPLADFWLAPERSLAQHTRLSLLATSLLGLDSEEFAQVQEHIARLVPHYEDVFEVKLLSAQQIFDVLKLSQTPAAIHVPANTAQSTALWKSHSSGLNPDVRQSVQSRPKYQRQVLNTAELMELLNAEIEGAKAGDWPLSVAAFSLDQYESMCTARGQAFAGRVMMTVARQYLGQQLRPTDFIGDLGDGIFILTLPGTNIENAHGVMERLRTKLSQFAAEHSQPRGFTASIGLDTYTRRVMYSGQASQVDELLARALQAHALARSAGGNLTIQHAAP